MRIPGTDKGVRGRAGALAILLTAVTVSAALAANPAGQPPSQRPQAAGLPSFFVPGGGSQDAPGYVLRNGELTAALYQREVDLASNGNSVRITFPGARFGSAPAGVNRLPGEANVLTGSDPSGWRTGLPVYGAVTYREIYPGIDMTFLVDGRRVKREFVVAPGADAAVIRMRFEGARRVQVGPDGGLVIETRTGLLREDAPVIFQVAGGTRRQVAGRFLPCDGTCVSFELGTYDRTLPLVIDPTLSFSTFLAGNGTDSATAVAVDGAGSTYVAGWTDSINFPNASGAQAANRGGVDAFVVKLNGTGNQLVFATYLGGSGEDRAFGMRLDSGGGIWLAGKTTSGNFPLAGSSSSYSGATDAFVARLNAQGNSLVFSRYLGGSRRDMANAIAVDSSGNGWVAGETASADFPVSSAFQATPGGGSDAFLAKISAAGAVLSSTYFGGAADDVALAIALDGQKPVVAGWTWSPDFPLQNALQPTPGGGQDAFVAKFNSTASDLVYSTYLGGSQGMTGFPEWATGVTVDSAGAAYVAGATPSPDFPTRSAYQPSYGGGNYDGFLTIINSAGSSIVASTYLGGNGNDSINAVALDGSGDILLAGTTASTNFPVASPSQAVKKALQDAFVTEFAPGGTTIRFSTFLGGSGADGANAVAAVPGGGFAVAGQTGSYDLPVTSAYQTTNYGTLAAFVTKFGDGVLPSVISVSPSSGAGSMQAFTLQYAHVNGASRLIDLYFLAQTGLVFPGACQVRYSVSSNGLYVRDDAGTSWLGPIAPGASSTLENSKCRIYAAYSMVTLAGTSASLQLFVEFKTAFAGARDVYLRAVDVDGADSDWQQKGSWTVASAATPAVLSVAPVDGSSGAGTQIFLFEYAHPNGSTSLAQAYGLIGSSTSYANACMFRYSGSLNAFLLMNDAGTAWGGAAIPNSATILENSQCILRANYSTIIRSGPFLKMQVSLQFKNAFVGLRNMYGDATDNAAIDSGWKQLGTWNVVQSNLPEVVSVTPSSGSSGSSGQTFAFEFHDADGYASFTQLYGMIHSSTNDAGGCQVRYSRSMNGLLLMNDAGTSWSGTVVPGSGSTIENSQCRIVGSSSYVYASGPVLQVGVTLQFKEPFAGSKNIYMRAMAAGELDTGWAQKGTWNVVASGSQSWGGSEPVSEASQPQPQTLLFDYHHPAGFENMAYLFGLLWDGTQAAGACHFVLNRLHNSLYLLNDANTAWLGPVAMGADATLENSQCRVIAARSAAGGSGSDFQMLVTLEFKPLFAGDKYVESRMVDVNGVDSGYSFLGTQTIVATAP